MTGPRLANVSAAQRRAYRWGVILAAVAVVVILLPGREPWHAAGPGNTGHEEIECGACHLDAEGSAVGQTFANLGAWLGIADKSAFFVFAPTGNRQCLDCHEHDDDRHPVARFMESKFAAAREQIGPQYCVNCHRQHEGVRVTARADFCQHCHAETILENDPVDVPHDVLIRQRRWDSCLQCHDFHGNHEREAPQLMAERLEQWQVLEYLGGGPSPYGERRLTVMETMRQDPQ